MNSQLEAIAIEHEAFGEELDEMLKNHAGQWVVFHDRKPFEFYTSVAEAYAEAIRRFGPEGGFLLQQVAPLSIELAWTR